MNAWSNILVVDQDPEITQINKLEASLGQLPDNVQKIRDLITRHEVCHFKFQKHIKKIEASIRLLEPVTDGNKIGINHIHCGEKAWEKDRTGRSLIGQQYIWAIKEWLNDVPVKETTDQYNKKLGKEIQRWLGNKNVEKERLVRLLLARLTWNWKLYEELQRGGIFRELEVQICSIDICHYGFPGNLNHLLHGIGRMKSIEKFEGCGSFNKKIQKFIEKELSFLNGWFESVYNKKPGKQNLARAWLIACLMKTLKEQSNLSKPIMNIQG